MKIFVSQPMSGLSDDEISANRKEAITHLSAKFPMNDITCDPSYLYTQVDEDKEKEISRRMYPDNLEDKYIGLYYFLRSIQHMVDCDQILFIDGWECSRGCCLEYIIARMFDIPRILMVRDKSDTIDFKIDDDDLLTIPLVLKLILNKIHRDKKYKSF